MERGSTVVVRFRVVFARLRCGGIDRLELTADSTLAWRDDGLHDGGRLAAGQGRADAGRGVLRCLDALRRDGPGGTGRGVVRGGGVGG